MHDILIDGQSYHVNLKNKNNPEAFFFPYCQYFNNISNN